jgi:hypothetical protein
MVEELALCVLVLVFGKAEEVKLKSGVPPELQMKA